MKKFFLILTVVFLWHNVDAQRFLGAIAFGTNLTQIEGDEIYGYKKAGFNVGVASFLPIHKKFFVSLELSFSQKGSYQKYPFEEDPTKGLPFYKLRLDYLEIPLLVHFEDKHFAMIGTGVALNRLVGVKEIEWGVRTPTTVRNRVYSHNDWEWVIDVRLRLYKSLRFDFRYEYSLAKIRTRTFSNIAGDTWQRDQFNNVLTFRLVYTFNEKINAEDEQNGQ